jgi:hypothetical protein
MHSWSKGLKTRLDKILQGLKSHKKFVEEQARLLQYRVYSQDRDQDRQAGISLAESLRCYEETLRKLSDDTNESEKVEYRKRYADVVNWFAAPDVSQKHEATCRLRAEYGESGRWVLEKGRGLLEWKDDEMPASSILWLNGIPGAGMFLKVGD